MMACTRSIFVALALALASASTVRADLWPFGDNCADGCYCCDCEDGWYSCDCAGPIVPNMIGAESLGLGYDNQIIQARLSFQHFLRVADNNSPLPRDRVSFGYKNYHRVRTAEGGPGLEDFAELQEFQFRAERTFLDSCMSVEVILPFAYTTDSNDTGSIASPPTLNGELGNVGVGLKGLLWSDGIQFVTAGLLVELPTADDRVNLLGGTLPNEAWYFSPYLAALYVPTERWFLQGFTSVRLATDSNQEVGLNREFTGPDMFMLDVGTGYLLMERREGLLRAVTPTIELHYTHSLEEFESAFPNTYAAAIGRFDMLTLTAGATLQLGADATLAGALAVPLRDGASSVTGFGPPDQQYDWAFLLQLNMYCR
jgi:hypothetical protein